MRITIKSSNYLKQLLITLLVLFEIHSAKALPPIIFETKLSMIQVFEKAKLENKYIFIDCYTTWCLPCKKMETDIYSIDSVASLMNKNFICLKVQLDSGKSDNEYVKSWYPEAAALAGRYKITAYPTFLFLAPDGRLVHEGIGYKNKDEFCEISRNALNPRKQYYTLLASYLDGERNATDMAYLMSVARANDDKSTLDLIGVGYTNSLLSEQSDSALFSKENIELLFQYTKSTVDRGYTFFIKNSSQVNNIMNDSGYFRRFIDKIIYSEIISPLRKSAIESKKEPDWNQIYNQVATRYDESYANRTVSRSKVSWYKRAHDYINYTRWTVISIENYSLDEDRQNWFYINNSAWEVYEFSRNTRELQIALSWVEKILQNNLTQNSSNPNLLDTYAHLLYRLNRKFEAVTFEKRAAKLAPEDSGIQENLIRMRAGTTTWAVKTLTR